MLCRVSLVFAVLCAAIPLRAERMSPELLWKLARVGSGIVSPDGELVAYTVRRYELKENKGRSDIVVTSRDGKKTRVVAEGLSGVTDLQWGRIQGAQRLFFVAKHGEGEDVTRQVWSLDPATKTLFQITSEGGGVDLLKVDPTGRRIAFTKRVTLDRTVNDIFSDLPHADARIIDSLLYRHWDSWSDGAYSHVHVAEIGSDGKAGASRDLMHGRRIDCPVPPFGGSEQFSWSPDGEEIAITTKIVSRPESSTDTDVYLLKVAEPKDDGKPKKRSFLCVTVGMNGYDMEPRYSPDGRYIAFHSMERPSFESDRNRIQLFDRKTKTIEELTVGLDQTTHGLRWTPDSKAIVFESEQKGTKQVFSIALKDRKLRQLSSGRFYWSVRDLADDGEKLIVARMSMLRPYELFELDAATGDAVPLSDVNGKIYKTLELPTIEERWVRSTDGKKVHNLVIRPPNFDPSKRWPMLTYCQGGPQSQVGQWFSFRWNFHLMAANGYVVLAVNRRGLPGFGREWNDQISRDWGGQAMQDILASTDSMLAEPYVDRRRVAAIGASFGGYTVYWLMGNHQNRFAAMISHCGVFNLESMYGSTEELFFVNWDLGGPYWKNETVRREYEKFSPHRFVGAWRTPLLVIHGEKDFRVPVTQGMEAFTAAQVQGVPSRFLYFPNEGHWVLSPQNGVLWHRVFFDWLSRHCSERGIPSR
ncbi:MAG: S9 family peptidase [Planctomycetota bacterium]